MADKEPEFTLGQVSKSPLFIILWLGLGSGLIKVLTLTPIGVHLAVHCWNIERLFEWNFLAGLWADLMTLHQVCIVSEADYQTKSTKKAAKMKKSLQWSLKILLNKWLINGTTLRNSL